MPFEIRPAYDWALAMKLYKAGALDGDIAAALGCSTAGVKWWRQKNNLPGQTRRRYE